MRLPALKPRKLIRALKRTGFEEVRQTGSHLVLAQRAKGIIVTVPIHAKDLKRGLVADIIKQASISQEEFLKLL